jgi:hypothetical protein
MARSSAVGTAWHTVPSFGDGQSPRAQYVLGGLKTEISAEPEQGRGGRHSRPGDLEGERDEALQEPLNCEFEKPTRRAEEFALSPAPCCKHGTGGFQSVPYHSVPKWPGLETAVLT